MKVRPIVYPFVIAVYPILSLYAINCAEVRPSQLTLPILLTCATVLVIWAALACLMRDFHRAGLISLVIVLLYNSVEMGSRIAIDLVADISRVWVYHRPQTSSTWAYLPCPTLLIGLGWYLHHKVKEPRTWTTRLNAFALVLVAFPVLQSVAGRSRSAERFDPKSPPALAKLPDQDDRPDIYYIILDGFARADVLKENFDYDLSPFLERLEQRGFYVARGSTSNYCQTHLSLGSSLNGIYHPTDPAPVNAGALIPQVYFSENAVYKSLEPLGYRFVTFSSGFDPTDNPGTDVYLSPYKYISDFHRLILTESPVRHLVSDRLLSDEYTMRRERSLFLFDQLPKIAAISGPKFTFAHILLPHPPFVFGEDGEDVSPRSINYRQSDGDIYMSYYGDAASYVRGYRGQAAYLVKRVDRMIDEVLAKSPKPPVIIIQSDHGSGLHLDLRNDKATDHHERMSILNAYYLPGGKRDGLYPTITPVNSFRVVFNNVFGTKLPLLPEENYYSRINTPFAFVNVTDQVTTKPTRSSAGLSNGVRGGN